MVWNGQIRESEIQHAPNACRSKTLSCYEVSKTHLPRWTEAVGAGHVFSDFSPLFSSENINLRHKSCAETQWIVPVVGLLSPPPPRLWGGARVLPGGGEQRGGWSQQGLHGSRLPTRWAEHQERKAGEFWDDENWWPDGYGERWCQLSWFVTTLTRVFCDYIHNLGSLCNKF